MTNHSKIALVYLPGVRDYSVPPVGISYLSSYLAANGYTSEVFDFNIELLLYLVNCKDLALDKSLIQKIRSQDGYDFKILNQYYRFIEYYSKELATSLEEIEKSCVNNESNDCNYTSNFSNYLHSFFQEKVKQLATYDIVGLSIIFTSQLVAAVILSKILKRIKPNIILVFGGAAVSRKELKNYASAIFLGDGEQQFLEYLKTASFLNNSSYFGRQMLIESLDVLPTPNLISFFRKYNYLAPELVIPLAITRGCYWGKCKFCSYGWIGHEADRSTARYRKASIEKIIAEIKYFVDALGARLFYFTVDVADPKLLMDLSRRLIDEGLDIYWRVEIRAEKTFLSTEVLKTLYQAGCRTVSFGLESVEQRVLDVMNKGVKADTNKKIIDVLYDVGIGINTDFFIGFPTETAIEAAHTQEFIINNSSKIIPHDVGGVFLVFAKSRIAKQGSDSLYYDAKNNMWVKAGMSFEEQDRQQEVAYVNAILNPGVARFPFRNDGVLFFVYCAHYTVKQIAALTCNVFIPEKIITDIQQLFAFVFYYLKEILKENIMTCFPKLGKAIAIAEQSLHFRKSKKEILTFYHGLILQVLPTLSLTLEEIRILTEIARFNLDYLMALLYEDQLPSIKQFDNKDFYSSNVLSLRDLALSIDKQKTLYGRYEISIKDIMLFDKHAAVAGSQSFAVFTINKVFVFDSQLPLDIVRCLMASDGKITCYELITKLPVSYSESEIKLCLQQLLANDVIQSERVSYETEADKMLHILSQLEAGELTLYEANQILN